MKKILTLSAALVLGVSGITSSASFNEAKATTSSDLAALMSEYVGDGQYTKKTTIYVDDAIEGFDSAYFHAGSNQYKRTTYYAPGALLMGNLNGGFDSINSGYANDGEGNMNHYHSTEGLNGLTDAEKREIDYTVSGKTMADYFYDLKDLAEISSDIDSWVYEEGIYTYTIESLQYDEEGEYQDPILKQFQYFAAPMLLTHSSKDASHYFSPASITVQETGGALSIKIYATSDTGKLWSDGGLLAEARV